MTCPCLLLGTASKEFIITSTDHLNDASHSNVRAGSGHCGLWSGRCCGCGWPFQSRVRSPCWVWGRNLALQLDALCLLGPGHCGHLSVPSLGSSVPDADSPLGDVLSSGVNRNCCHHRRSVPSVGVCWVVCVPLLVPGLLPSVTAPCEPCTVIISYSRKPSPDVS